MLIRRTTDGGQCLIEQGYMEAISIPDGVIGIFH